MAGVRDKQPLSEDLTLPLSPCHFTSPCPRLGSHSGPVSGGSVWGTGGRIPECQWRRPRHMMQGM